MKYRLIQRKDGKYQYEQEIKEPFTGQMLWDRINDIIFYDEETARTQFLEIITFTKRSDVHKIIDEIEV